MQPFLQITSHYFRFCLFLSLISVTSVAAAADEFIKLSVTGVNEALQRNIVAHLGTLPESEVQRRAFLFNVDDNVSTALESMGYYHGEVEEKLTEHDKGPWELKLVITAGEPTIVQWVDINFSGEMLDDRAFDQWLAKVNLKPGDVLNHGVYSDVKSQLVTLALARGYFDGEFTESQIKVNRDINTAQVSLHFDSGKRYKFGQVSFEGHTLEPEILEKLIPFKEGASYSTRRVGALNRQLLDTGYFANIKVIPQIDGVEESHIPVLVELTPKASHAIELGFGGDIGKTDQAFDPRVRVTWRTPQINKYGHSQETSLEWSPDRPKLLTTYTIPLTHPLDDQLKIRVGLLRDKYGVTQVYDAENRDFSNTGQLESTKYLLGLLRQQRLENQWLMSYSLEAIREEYTQSDVDYMPSFYLAGINFSRTTRGDNSLDPKSGFRQIYSLDYADPYLGSETRLARLQAKFKWIDTFFDNHRIVARIDLAANLANENDLASIPPSLRYFAGGDQSVRGYGYQELGPYLDYVADDGKTNREVIGGRYLMVGSLEYQYYVTPTWRVGTFIDAGNAFDNNQFEPVVSVGGGIHWISPIGPIKLDLGVGLKETDTIERSWRIHLTMGTDL
ncbi:autotransporter assembly complex family protein [Shewanella baltica]|uniref:autotransporter assembly complex protein TamA n=1 Tax=Shewanella TaxID=22 RepID=UPI0021681941|nr:MULTISPECIES: autotransporter assembly complex family protein [Shewanella]MCS6115850.1 outer membrane protein assembly factor [Shewanella baltica]MCS6119965.1 outer membrane protein assembly factor [Shewanella baltica]MCS6208075.1 outer membrane protein assembly factor [Shewanella baltica]MCS6230326.1 outer membrane protein assembly factor [Shewanella baltica]MDR9767249.1 autotransporter assembly complex family protein [Shewanella baltica]